MSRCLKPDWTILCFNIQEVSRLQRFFLVFWENEWSNVKCTQKTRRKKKGKLQEENEKKKWIEKKKITIEKKEHENPSFYLFSILFPVFIRTHRLTLFTFHFYVFFTEWRPAETKNAGEKKGCNHMDFETNEKKKKRKKNERNHFWGFKLCAHGEMNERDALNIQWNDFMWWLLMRERVTEILIQWNRIFCGKKNEKENTPFFHKILKLKNSLFTEILFFHCYRKCSFLMTSLEWYFHLKSEYIELMQNKRSDTRNPYDHAKCVYVDWNKNLLKYQKYTTIHLNLSIV